MMNKEILIAAGVFLLLLFVVVQWHAAHRPSAPLSRLPVEKQRELAYLNRQLKKAAAEGDDRGVYYYDGLMIGILVLELPELDFIQIRHTLNKLQEEP